MRFSLRFASYKLQLVNKLLINTIVKKQYFQALAIVKLQFEHVDDGKFNDKDILDTIQMTVQERIPIHSNI